MNRGENYHQLRRAVSFASFGKLRFKTEYEQEIWSECSRLIANCIIFYNASILVQAKRRRYRKQVEQIDARRLVFADETGVNYNAVGEAMDHVTLRDILGWFNHSGLYATHG